MNDSGDGIAPWLPGVLLGGVLFLTWLVAVSVIHAAVPAPYRIVALTAVAGVTILLLRRIDPVATRLRPQLGWAAADMVRLMVPSLLILWGSTWLLAALADPVVFDAARGQPLERGLLAWVGALVFVGILVPIVEELFFRGIVQRGMSAYMHPGLGLLTGAVLFALVHERAGPMVAQPFIAGLLFGYVVWHSGTLLSGIVLHAAGNGIPYVLGSLVSVSQITPWTNVGLTLFVSGGALIAGILGVFHYRKREWRDTARLNLG